MENLLLLGVPIFKHIRVDLWTDVYTDVLILLHLIQIEKMEVLSKLNLFHLCFS